jgi:two-component system, OmpR family, sensor histidine kinase ChvG
VKFLFSIRGKLLLVSLILLAIPVVGYRFVTHMEAFLRESQEQALASATRAIAATLSERPGLFVRREATPDEAAELERRQVVALFGSSDPEAVATLGATYQPSAEIERILEVLARSASRIWVVDSASRVRGLSGSLKRATPNAESSSYEGYRPLSRAMVRLFRLPTGDAKDDPEQGRRAVMAQVDRALIGSPSAIWRYTRDRQGVVLSAAQPVWSGDDIVGAVVVEETTGAIQLLKLEALENLLTITLIVFVAGFVTLILFAWRLAARVRSLGRAADAAIDAQGRIRGDLEPSEASDELGELSRNLAATVRRLKDYNQHLESLSARLSHELRTPVAVVRSSLDNLKLQPVAPEAAVYIERADTGVQRLSTLISRLSEATQLERFLQGAEREKFDPGEVVAGCVAGYRATFPARIFAFENTTQGITLSGVPDALAQLLDKLVANAIDFQLPGTPIEIRLSRAGRYLVLAVSNQGPPLPEGSAATLFSSMVSLRTQMQGRQPGEGMVPAPAPHGEVVGHLGMGLYIVRLIAEFHGGFPEAANRADGRGVEMRVWLALDAAP